MRFYLGFSMLIYVKVLSESDKDQLTKWLLKFRENLSSDYPKNEIERNISWENYTHERLLHELGKTCVSTHWSSYLLKWWSERNLNPFKKSMLWTIFAFWRRYLFWQALKGVVHLFMKLGFEKTHVLSGLAFQSAAS